MDLSQSDPPDDQDLSIRVDHDRAAALARMTVSGEVDSLSCAELHRTFAETVDRHRPEVVVMDVRGVTFIDSTGIRTLVTCRDEAELAGCHLALAEVPRIVYRVLDITGLLEYLGLAPTGPPPRTPAHRAESAG